MNSVQKQEALPAKCRRAKGATLELCPPAQYSVSKGIVKLQTLRDFETNKTRQRLAIVKGAEWAPLHYCPWCRADIDTRQRERSDKANKSGDAA